MDRLPIAFVLFCFIICTYQTESFENRDVLQIRAALFLEKKNTSIYDEIHFRPAVDIALRKVNELALQQPIPFNIGYTYYSTGTGCAVNGLTVASTAARILINKEVDVIFGPMCDDEAVAVADLAANFQIPMFAAFGTDPALLNKNRFKTYTRMSHTRDVAANFVAQIFLRFDWKACTILWKDADYHRKLVNNVVDSLRKYFVVVNTVKFADFSTSREALIASQREARIILLVMDGPEVRETMLNAYDLGYTTGEYAFIAFNTRRSGSILEHENWKLGSRDVEARNAYEALMWIRLYEPVNERFPDFISNVVAEEYTLFEDYTKRDAEIEFSKASFHDAIVVYFKAVNESLTRGVDYRGIKFTRSIWGRDFVADEGIGVFDHIAINDNGDREADYSLWDMTQLTDGTFEVVENYIGLTGEINVIKSVRWPTGASGPPLGIPVIDNSSPTERYIMSAVAIAVTPVFILGVIALIFFYCRKSSERMAETTSNWKINLDEVTIVESFTFSGATSSAVSHISSNISGRTSTSTTQRTGSNRGVVKIRDLPGSTMKFGNYKGHRVTVKKIHKQTVELSKTVVLELQSNVMADHDNIARFYGACVDNPICIFNSFCPRGSLKDLIKSVSIIENELKHTLIVDIAKGLNYLHNCPVGVHGRLHWKNCLIDSRFVLQLTDFGLHEFRAGEIDITIAAQDQIDVQAKRTDTLGIFRLRNELLLKEDKGPLWKAPEHLRSPALPPTQKGDIYAAGLLMQTILTELGPYEEDEITFNLLDVIEELKTGTTPPFRPKVGRDLCGEDVYYCMQKCWEEDPRARPNSRQVLSAVRRGKEDENIVQSLMTRMQKYADKLEALVDERTAAFIEEKQHTEKLLYEVLPKSVAKQLMQGKVVDPESFVSVTICFSDIIGFTEMSSTSSPMQVIDLLNTLYTMFDKILTHYDVYKVETIGDAYMVASGLPIRNGNVHAYEIAKMSFNLVQSVTTVKAIGARSNEHVMLRVGIHSGQCVAGVVGQTMPRYCLFGDTVNMASRLESTGEAQKIHISHETKEILQSFGVFETELRGELELKGKGIQTTHWLLRDKSASPSGSRLLLESVGSSQHPGSPPSNYAHHSTPQLQEDPGVALAVSSARQGPVVLSSYFP